MAQDIVNIVDSSFQVLRVLANSSSPMGVRELARNVDVSKSSVQRILTSMRRAGFAVADPQTGRYSIAPGVLTLAWRFLRESELVGAARGVVTRLRDETDETVALSTIVGIHRVTLLELESPEPLRFAVGVGKPLSLLTGATARVLLAQLSEEGVLSLLSAQEPVQGGEGAIADRAQYLDRIAVVRRIGYEMSRNEWSDGAVGIAVPLATHNGMPLAMSLYGPVVRLPATRCKVLLRVLREAAEEIRAAAPWFGEPTSKP